MPDEPLSWEAGALQQTEVYLLFTSDEFLNNGIEKFRIAVKQDFQIRLLLRWFVSLTHFGAKLPNVKCNCVMRRPHD